MKSDKLFEAIITANTTIMMQLEIFSKSVNDSTKVAIALSEQLFRLPKKERTFPGLEKELTLLLMKQLGFWGVLKSMIVGLFSSSGPIEGIKKTLIVSACRKMGLAIPVTNY